MKTISLKKVSAVAVASLGFGLLSVVPAQAAVTAATITSVVGLTTGGTSTAATASQAVGNQVTATITPTGTGDIYLSYTGVGSIMTANDTNDIAAGTSNADTAFTALNGLNYSNGGTTAVGTTLQLATFALTSTTAGTQTVKVQTLDAATGLYTSLATLTVTWVDAANTDLGSASAYVLANGATCDGAVTASTVGAQDRNNATALVLCVVLKNALASAYTRSTAVSVTSNGVGLVAGAAVAADGAVTAGYKAFAITGNGLPGTMELAVTASSLGSDGVTTVTKTASAKIINNGDFTAITLTNLKKSIAYNTATAGTIDYAATDAKSNAAAIDLGSGATWYVESDKGTTAVSSTASNNSSASVASAAADTITAATGASADAGRATVTSGAAYEKLTIWVTKKNAAGTTVTSNKIVVYVSTAVTAVKTVNVTSATANGATTLTIEALSDAATTTTAYPVVDGAALTIGATGGSLSATSATIGVSGVATVTFYPSQVGGDSVVTITATDPSTDVVKTQTVASAGNSLLTQIDALNAKIVALNALIAKIMKKLGIK